MKIYELIDELKKWHQPYTESPTTRDVYLFGDPDIECTGVALTATASLKVLKKCVEEGINLIISHEGITYNYEKIENIINCDNPIVKEKVNYMKEHNLVIWRDHDHMHGNGGTFFKNGQKITIERNREDSIFAGTAEELGWKNYIIGDNLKPLWYKIPKTNTTELAKYLIEKYNCNGIRIVGNMNAEIETVYFVEHVLGGEKDIPTMDNALKADAMISFEIVDYTLTQYIKDAAEMGYNKVIFELGHFTAEELGMKYLATIIKELVNDEIKVLFIPAADTFEYITK